ncbi:MAG: LysM peptidoglycan-binding domain-containing protein [Gammaproteobacteria bacterium]|nr:LysM peptidoglycan-binding domain-containing protein [Gammaproteobacteria bacterium]MDE2346216.1 LysM peptidoglycan-binding domain-containing protein [Gammaproteobacteria bacterium]
MKRCTILAALLCACGLLVSGCATLDHNAPAKSASTAAPAAASSTPAASAASADTATPIPDLNDNSPQIKWENITIAPAVINYDNLWDYLGKNFSLSSAGGDGRVQGELNWYADHGAYLQRMANRASPYLYYIVQQVRSRKMPLDIALLPVVESAYDPYGYSVARAAGLWQFIPDTGRHWDLKQNWWYDGRRDIAASTNAALDYLQYLHTQFNNDWLLALAAYNSGSGTVEYAIRRNQARGLPTDFWHLDLPAQTRAYVPRLLAICKLVAASGHYGVSLPPIPNQPYLAEVNVGGQIDLAKAAKLAGITTDQMYMLNPGFNRWATDPNGPYTLLVPIDKKNEFMTALAALPPHDRVQWDTHRVKNGDTLGGIAFRYHTTVAVLRQLNGIHGNLIRLHQMLLIPVSRRTLADATLMAEARVARIPHYGHDRHESHGRIIHPVRPGESLWSIARRYRVNVAELRHWNGLHADSILHVGQKITIYSSRSRVVDTAYTTGQGLHNVLRTVYYTVREGDSLYSISTHFKVSVSDIADWNGIDPHHYLHAGEQLKLYVDVSDQSSNG